MKKERAQISFRQMNGPSNSHVWGTMICLFGCAFLAAGIFMICVSTYEGILFVFAGLVIAFWGFSIQKSRFCRVQFTETEILLTMGPRVLHRMQKTDVQTLCLIIESVILRDRRGVVNQDVQEETKTYLLVLSPHPPSYFRYMAKRWIDPKVELREYRSEEAREYAIIDSAIDAYFRANMSDFKMAPSDGIWLEYTSERYKELKKQVPQAADYVSDYEDQS